MIQLSAKTNHINNGFGAHNVGAKMGISGVQYSGSYGANLFVTISTHTLSVNKDTSFALSVAHNDLQYSPENYNDRTTNGSTCK